MSYSSLATAYIPAHSNNYTVGREGNKICKFTPHIMAGMLTAEQCGKNIFQSPTRLASSNYGIGKDGEIACYVDEENRAWTSSSRSNDYQAITVEIGNCEIGGEWKISDEAWNSLVKLAVDVCKRYNFKLVYDGTPNGSLTRHNMFANTICPGAYLQSRLSELANTVNSMLEESTPQTIQQSVQECKKNDVVVELQKVLNTTYRAGLAVDGIIGPLTKAALKKVALKNYTANTLVTWVQNRLVAKGIYLKVDGKYGPDTANKIKEFQRKNDLGIDGIAGINTILKLL